MEIEMSEMRRTSEQAEKMLQAWESSGLTLADWARQQGLGYETVRRWRHRLRGPVGGRRAARAEQSSKLVPVRVVPTQGAELDVRLPNGLQVRVPRDFDSAHLTAVIQVAQEC